MSPVRDLLAPIVHDVAPAPPVSVQVPVAPSRSTILQAAITLFVVIPLVESVTVVGESTQAIAVVKSFN